MKKLLCVFVFVFLFCSCAKKSEPEKIYEVTGNFTITNPKTEETEFFLLKTKSCNILVDSAKSENAKDIIDFLKSENISKIDYFIITQFSENSLGSASTILRKLEVKNICQPSYIPQKTRLYEKYTQTLKFKGITPHTIKTDETLTVEDIHFEFFGCDNALFENNENNCSLVFKITHGKNRFLFSGNIKNERIEELISKKADICAEFIKMPNNKHTEKTKDFIKYVNPEIAFICCSENYPASTETEKILKERKIKTFYSYNDIHTFISDGNTITERKN